MFSYPLSHSYFSSEPNHFCSLFPWYFWTISLTFSPCKMDYWFLTITKIYLTKPTFKNRSIGVFTWRKTNWFGGTRRLWSLPGLRSFVWCLGARKIGSKSWSGSFLDFSRPMPVIRSIRSDKAPDLYWSAWFGIFSTHRVFFAQLVFVASFSCGWKLWTSSKRCCSWSCGAWIFFS